MQYLKRFVKMWAAILRERRESRRVPAPLVAYYWNGGVPQAHPVKSVSPDGAYILTADRWRPGTLLGLTFQYSKVNVRGSPVPDDSDTSIAVKAKLVRSGSDGMGVSLIHLNQQERRRFERFLAGVQREHMTRAGCEDRSSRGEALIELALVLPLLFLFIVNVVNFGAFYFAWITVANAARAGAQYTIMGGASAGSPAPATAAQISTLVTNDVSSLLNRSSLAVRVCTNNNGVVTCVGPGASLPSADPEPATYVLATVDVTYTYQPPIALWSFPNLSIRATLPPTAIHRKGVMRMIQ
jgi:Flp pilus assembly protein TadG